MYAAVCENISKINNILWGFGTVLAVFGAGIFITLRIKCFNITHLGHILKTAFSNKDNSGNDQSNGNISHFQALSTALAASMGTGNIIGVAAAISIGGCGAVFWMWVSAIFGTGIGISENILGGKYLKLEEAQKRKCLKLESGPMAYIANGINIPSLAALYALSCAAASFGIGNMTQSNAFSASLSEFGISYQISGALAAVFCGTVIFGGGKKVARTAEKIVPAVSLFYIAGAIVVIVIFGKNITEVLKSIFLSAIGYSQIAGGISGAVLKKTVSSGLRRGVFSNEAGMGSSVLVHTETGCAGPMRMGMWAAAEIVIDTLVCCTATALVILLTGADASGTEGLAMVTEGFRRGFGRFGSFAPLFTGVSSAVFAICTLLGWYFYGEKCVLYIFGNESRAAVTAVMVYRVLYVAAAFIGAVSELTLVLEAADLLNWSMLAINLTAVLILSGEAAEVVSDHRKSLKAKRSHSESDTDGF